MIARIEPAGHDDLLPEAEVACFDRAALARHLAAVGIQFDPRQPILQFAGGLANRNYLIELETGPAVLRRPPAGELPRGAHDMAREHRVLSRLSKVLPFVPDSLHLCEDAGVIGAPFQLMEYRPGLVLRGATIKGLPSDAPARLSRMMIETLAAIHGVDAAACGLGDLGRPAGFLQRTIEGWRARGRDATDKAATVRLIEEIAAWLARFSFTERRPTLLHLDFKLDNIILHPETLQPVGVVDWDMSTRGDPLLDLATLLSYWSQTDDPGVVRTLDIMPTCVVGFWTRRQAADHYSSITGMQTRDLQALRVLAFLKFGVVFLQLHRQWLSGAVKRARYAKFDRFAEDILHHAHDLTLEPST